ncbi:collagenase-like [Lucilia sericata]|uniref:collagenase-like n=1 Tax=Lucilia sericata TaxID=13632 RepID=UPI0018A836E9|nr:collagenase-like [Lucilia sericata]
MITFCYKLATLWFLFRLNLLQVYISATSNSQSAAIISGTKAELGQFPWYVLLKRNKKDKLLCGASLISNKWVLTCAHCIDDEVSVVLVFGTIKRTNMEVFMTSKKFFIHPAYDDEYLFNDIGLIELHTPVTFNDNIKAIELISPADAAKNQLLGAEAIIAGYGQTTDNIRKYSLWLLYASVAVVNKTICEEAYEEQIEDSVICTKASNNSKESACDGDSGGPLVWKNAANKFVQIGISSFSMVNECSKFPSGYTRVSSYYDYIHNITGLNFN